MASVARSLLTAVLAAAGAGVVLHALRPDTPPAPPRAPDAPAGSPLDPDDLDADELSPMQLRALLREFARMDGDDPDADMAAFDRLLAGAEDDDRYDDRYDDPARPSADRRA